MNNAKENRSPRFESVQCTSWKEPAAKSGGGAVAELHRFAWTEWGERENPRVLVCVHGLTRSGRDFDALARALADSYRVVCPDIVGRGRSGWLEDSQQYAISQYVADCVTLIARLGVAQVDWVGTSMGGLIGMALAALEGNPIRKLVLNDIGPQLSPLALARIGDYVGKQVRFATFAEGERYLRTIHASFGPHTDAEWRALSESVLLPDGEGARLHYDPRIGDAFRAPTSAVPTAPAAPAASENPWSGYDRIRAPTLAIRGAESDLLSASVHEEMGRRGPHATLATLAGIGHAPTLIHADQIALVREFLER
jgi:pimeloyl-ACP methyl ester carboxylesterase